MTSGIRPDFVSRIRNIVAVLVSAQDMNGVKGPPGWRVHSADRRQNWGWSISASGNWRVTFNVERGEICNLDLEDYH